MNKNTSKVPARSTQRGALAQNNKKKKSRPRRKKGISPSPVMVHISACAKDYARAKLDPFSSYGNLSPCIPDLLDLPSMKFSTIMRGVASIGTAGFGSILVAPSANCNDRDKVWFTNNSYTASVVPGSTGVGVLQAYDAQYPWPEEVNRNVRVVASALRVRYTGTELNRSGRIVMTQNDAITQVPFQGNGIADLLGRPEAMSMPVTRAWRTISYLPAFPVAYEYNASSYYLGPPDGSNGRLLAVFDGVLGNTFEWEVVTYYEAISASGYAVTNVSKSHADPVGYGFVKDFLATTASGILNSDAYSKFLDFASKGALATASSYFVGSTSRYKTLEL